MKNELNMAVYDLYENVTLLLLRTAIVSQTIGIWKYKIKKDVGQKGKGSKIKNKKYQ